MPAARGKPYASLNNKQECYTVLRSGTGRIFFYDGYATALQTGAKDPACVVARLKVIGISNVTATTISP